MSDPVSNHDIEDVLSSIRRLVAQGDPRRVAAPAVSKPAAIDRDEADPTADEAENEDAKSVSDDIGRLVLTPAFRVLTPEDSEDKVKAPEPANASDPAPDLDKTPLKERASLEAKIAALEAAVSGVADDFEPDGSEAAAKPPLETSVFTSRDVQEHSATEIDADPESALNDAVVNHLTSTITDEIAGAFPNLNATEVEPEIEDTVVQLNPGRNTPDSQPTADATEDARLSQEVAEEEVIVVAPKIHKPAAFRKDPEPSIEAQKPESTAETEVEVVDPVTTDAPTFRHASREVYDPVAEATADAAEAEAEGDFYGDELAQDKDEPGTAVAPAAAPGALMDPDMLRDMVGQMIREELQGEMGERITRNVRKLVRREINRVLSAQEFD